MRHNQQRSPPRRRNNNNNNNNHHSNSMNNKSRMNSSGQRAAQRTRARANELSKAERRRSPGRSYEQPTRRTRAVAGAGSWEGRR